MIKVGDKLVVMVAEVGNTDEKVGAILEVTKLHPRGNFNTTSSVDSKAHPYTWGFNVSDIR